ncbi:MAG: carbonic anhydrase family protein [Flavobacteriaceae bacterium]|nr:carbonic anhydrase family protein [Flavobacteriaceae bacterium]
MDNGKTQTKQTQSEISSHKALELLKKGNDRFLKNKFLNRDYNEQISISSQGQFPFAIVLSCIDSRVPVETIFDQGIGDVFSVRVAGNVISKDILGSVEYACKFAGVKLIVVLGHTSCGAVKGACDGLEHGNLTHLLKKIQPAIDKTKTKLTEFRDSSNIDFVNAVANNNLLQSIKDIKSKSLTLKEMLLSKDVLISSAMYNVDSGVVKFNYL